MNTTSIPGPPRALLPLLRQFARPSGLLGALAGRMMARRNGPTNQALAATLAPLPGETVLDLGCGPGLGLAALDRRGVALIGLDVSPVMIRQARRHNRSAVGAGRLTLHVAPAEHMPLGSGSLDAVMSLNTYHHLDDRDHALEEIHRVLRPGGRLVLGLRLRRLDASSTDPAARAMTDEGLVDVALQLRRAGFTVGEVTVELAGVERLGVIRALR
jgi:ubiquinone/menaquinone biosynthesis C-methylase UbiE